MVAQCINVGDRQSRLLGCVQFGARLNTSVMVNTHHPLLMWVTKVPLKLIDTRTLSVYCQNTSKCKSGRKHLALEHEVSSLA
jgi:hypothetical protein